MNDLKIIIIGRPGTGKSVLACALQNLLLQHGCQSEIVGDPTEPEAQALLRHEDISLRLDHVMNTKRALIETRQLRRDEEI